MRSLPYPMLLKHTLFLLLVSLGFTATLRAGAPDPILDLNAQVLNAIRVSRTPPPMASHHLAVFHLALYDTVNSFTGSHRPYLVKERAPAGASLEAAIASAGHTVLQAAFGKIANPRVFADDYQTALDRLPNDESREAGVAWGRTVAQQIIQSRADAGLTATVEVRASETMGHWRPTPPLFRSPTLPQWSRLKPFALRSPEHFRPPPPPDLASAAYAVDFDVVKRWGGRDSELRTEEQTFIAAFWSDDLGTATPPGHWNIIASTVSRERELTLEQNARLFALLNLGMADSAIGCWEAKFCYSFWRPETAIREADHDGNAATEPDPEWIPLMPSPTFPDYVSGHSTFSRCAATILARFFGTDAIPFSTPGEGLTDAVRSFPGFSAAADEVGVSRVFGGIHFPSANFWGQAQGRAIGEYVMENFLQPAGDS
jgi:hypothetical protein